MPLSTDYAQNRANALAARANARILVVNALIEHVDMAIAQATMMPRVGTLAGLLQETRVKLAEHVAADQLIVEDCADLVKS
ncbi:hypothetical protein PQ43W_52 [Ralstonia phage PQ43W]